MRMDPTKTLAQRFQEKAEAVSAVVKRVSSVRETVDYVVDLCAGKEACQMLMAGCEAPLSGAAGDLCDTKQAKTIAAPGLPREELDLLTERCGAAGIGVTTDALRDHLAGIDIGLTYANFGIADTGTLVIDSRDEDIRLATMVSEIHVAVLPGSRLRKTAYDVEADLRDRMQQTPDYTAFITGASRTADIERVLALGVHGPLELHILIREDA
jgi:L-lactate dehydrogenase complex protein LldG